MTDEVNRQTPPPQAHLAVLEQALAKINDIRNSIIGCQKMNWSEHIYPLVAALNEAGIEGQSYPEAREYVGTMLERTLAAENEASNLRKALADARALLSADYGSDGRVVGVSHEMDGLRRMISMLDAALATTEGSTDA